MATTEQEHGERVSQNGESPSFVALIKRLRDDTTYLLRQEVELARTEVKEKVKNTTENLGQLAVASAIIFAGVLFILTSLTIGIGFGFVAAGMVPAVAAWLAPLIVGVTVAVIGGAAFQVARSELRREGIQPQQTRDSLREDKEWLKHRTR